MKEIKLLNDEQRKEELNKLRKYMQQYIEVEWPENETNYMTMSDEKMIDTAILHTKQFFKEQLRYADFDTYIENEREEKGKIWIE